MCGIVGMIGQSKEDRWGETHRILSHLLLAAEVRGTDATGFVARVEALGGTGKRPIIVAKDAISASKFIQRTQVWKSLGRRRCSAVVCHTRLATHGDPAFLKNDHPFVGSGLSLVHNGVLSSHEELVDKYCLRTVSECDSEVLLRIIERAKTVPVGLSLCLIERPGAIVVYDEHRDICWLARDDSRPLWVCRMKNDRRLFFGSTSGILIEGIQDALKTSVHFDFLLSLAPGHVHCASANGTIGAVYEDPIGSKLAGWT